MRSESGVCLPYRPTLTTKTDDINMNQLIAATGTNKTVHYIANYTDLDFTLGKICEGLGKDDDMENSAT